MNLTTLQTGLIAVAGITAALILIYAVIAPMFDTKADAERTRQARAEKAAAKRAADSKVWLREYLEHGVIYPELFPEALEAEHERLTRTADLPAVAPLLVPLPVPGSVEPTAVLPPGTPLPLPEGEIHPRVAAALAEFADDAESTFVRQLVTAPLDEIPALFNRPLALTAGGAS